MGGRFRSLWSAAWHSGLGHLSTGVSQGEAEALFKRYDKDGNGVLDWSECKLLAGDLVQAMLKEHKDRSEELKAALEDPETVNKVLVAFDGDRDGNVSRSEFVEKAMHGYAFPLPPRNVEDTQQPPAKRQRMYDEGIETTKPADTTVVDEHEQAYMANKEAEEAACQGRNRVYDEKMAEVERQHNLMVDCYDKASKAHAAGEYNKITGLKEEAAEHKLLKKQARDAALQFMFERANKDSDGTWLDLHGLQVEFALKKTEEFLDKAKGDGRSDCNIITGAGHHSGPGGPAIKPKVWEMLTGKTLNFTEINAGEIKVALA